MWMDLERNTEERRESDKNMKGINKTKKGESE
jgi:hypothetical protein